MLNMANTTSRNTEQKKQHTYTPVYSLYMAGHLMQRGFVPIYCKRNEFQDDRIVYYFLKSNRLDKAITEYLAKTSNR